jgi:hypothetical protein
MKYIKSNKNVASWKSLDSRGQLILRLDVGVGKVAGYCSAADIFVSGSQPTGSDAIEKVMALNANLTIDEISVMLQRISWKFCSVTSLSNDHEC